MPGLEHKYHDTAVLLISIVCGGICRYCFRKRVFINPRKDLLNDLPAAVEYLEQHPEITNVLITGGDPLALSTKKLEKIIDALLPLENIKIIRIGSKMPAFNPYRILDDPSLLMLMRRTSSTDKQLYVLAHFNHPREITDLARQGLKAMLDAGVVIANQTPLIRGINDNPDVLAELFKTLSFVGVPPYYLFQCRPASGNINYSVPIEEAYQIFAQAKAQVSGLAKRARFVMSHRTGKIEILGLTDKHVFFKYHRAFADEDNEKFMVFDRNPYACWLDDYGPPVETQPLELYQNIFDF
jgi:lysine 2,3-aminomutase